MSQRPAGPQATATRPKTSEIGLKSVLTFPLRICNPPPAVGKVRSCGVTPLFKVRLEDVLDRNHLPPLGLKDFEEWLLYVEMSPENLYFTLWLREYRQRYATWQAQNKMQRAVNGDFQLDWEIHHSPSLAMFYARAKQTFFTPNSPYELNVPSSLLAVFHSPMESPHPDPMLFNDVAIETWRLLDESLRRFVSAQFNNVGNNRVLCGIIAGILFALIGAIPPLTLNFTRHESRWLRLLAFPGLFLGLAILVSAFHGVCLGVYIFGDLRQLRKFELARPPISRPVPVAETKPEGPPPALLPPARPAVPEADAAVDEKSAKAPTSSGHGIVLLPRRPPSITSDEHSVYSRSVASSESGPEIQISPAFCDNSSMLDLDGQVAIANDFAFPAQGQSPIESDYTATATFIHPFDTSSIDVKDYDQPDFCPAERQPIDTFDFDSLPPLQPKKRPSRVPVKDYEQDCCQSHSSSPQVASHSHIQHPRIPETTHPKGFLERQQSTCDIKKWRLQTEPTDQLPDNFNSPSGNPYNWHILRSFKSHRSLGTEATFDSSETKVRKRSRLMAAVPAFAVPLTRVLSPVIRRGQWEIVVRSAVISFLVSWVVVGSLLAVPVAAKQ